MGAFRSEPVPFTQAAADARYVLKAGDTMTGSLLPSPDNSINLGSAAARWQTAFAYSVDLKTGINGVANLNVGFTQAAAGVGGFTLSTMGGQGGAAGAGAGGAGGTWTGKGGAGGDGSAGQAAGAGGNISLLGGNAGANNGGGGANGGDVLVDGGSNSGAGTGGNVKLGTSGNTNSVQIGHAGITTQVFGTLRYDNTSGSATAGAISPPNFVGYLVLNTGGTTIKVPYLNN